MSIESAKAFYQRITTDEAFRTQVESYSIEERTTFLQAEGYDFTQEEWEAATAEILEASSIDAELNEAELEAVAGGKTIFELIRDLFPPVAMYGVAPNPFDEII